MNSRLLQVLCAACMLLWSHLGAAVPTLIGNVAHGSTLLSVEIDGLIVVSNLAYREFREIDVAVGHHRVRMLNSSTGAVLFDELPGQDWEVRPDWPQHIVLQGDGSHVPLDWARTSPRRTIERDYLPYPPDATGMFFWLGGGSGFDRHRMQIECPQPDGSIQTTGAFGGGGTSNFSSVFRPSPGQAPGEGEDCRLDLKLEYDGVLRVFPTINASFEGGTYYLFDVGNGSAEAPYELIMVKNGAEIDVPYFEVPDTMRRVKSRNYWYDAGRSAQGITLYEASRTQAVHGLWNLFASDGRPRWLYMDGGVVDASGRREVVLYEYTKQPGGPRNGTTVAQGTLTYLSCNLAELQVQFADGSTRAAQFRRSVEVSTCAALP